MLRTIYYYRFLLLLLCIFLARFNALCPLRHPEDFSTCGSKHRSDLELGASLQKQLEKVRQASASKVRSYIPSPHSELLLGAVLGINDLKKVPRFNDVVRATGTIHVIVVSGYNINLVYALVLSIVGSKYNFKNLLTAWALTFFYAMLSGFGPPVVRAWIMSMLTSTLVYAGRKPPTFQVLLVSALVMLCFSPIFALSLSFQFSFLAALSMVAYGDMIQSLLKKLSKQQFVLGDLASTLAAQVLVWPLISYYFGAVSVISPLVNALVLWTIPLATLLGGVFVLTVWLNHALAQGLAYLIIVPLDIFVKTVFYFGKYAYATVNFHLLPAQLCLYYSSVLVLKLVFERRKPRGK